MRLNRSLVRTSIAVSCGTLAAGVFAAEAPKKGTSSPGAAASASAAASTAGSSEASSASSTATAASGAASSGARPASSSSMAPISKFEGLPVVPTNQPPPADLLKETPRDPNDPYEEEGKTYFFLGARYRHTFLPKWMLNLFVSGGPTSVSIPSFGVEGTMRKDGFDTILSLTYSDYSMATFPFKGKDEADTAYELITSKLKMLNVNVDLLWGADIGKYFSFQYGATAGIAVVFGDLKRVQASPVDPATGQAAKGAPAKGDPYTYVPCAGPKTSTYCDDSNDHYGDYDEKSWFNGGKKPNLYAAFGPMIALRFKPAKQFMMRLDGGFNIFSGAFFGTGLNYGF